MIDFIKQLFDKPDAFLTDPRKYVANQMGHFWAVGWGVVSAGDQIAAKQDDIVARLPDWLAWVPAVLTALMSAPGVLIIYAIWEFKQWKLRGADPSDCWEDLGFVCMGVLFIHSPAVLLLAAIFLMHGYSERRGR